MDVLYTNFEIYFDRFTIVNSTDRIMDMDTYSIYTR